MAEKSEHEKTDGGWQSHPAWERLHPQEPTRLPDLGIREGRPQRGISAAREGLFAYLFQVSSDGVALHELLSSPEKGRFVDVNDGLCRMVGYGRQEILKLTPFDLVGEEAKKAIPELVREIERSGRMSFEITLIGKARRPISVEIHASIVQFHRRRMVLSIIHEVTERKQIEQEPRRWNEHLEEEVEAQTEELKDVTERLQDETARRVLAESKLHRRSRMLEAFFQDTITPLAFLDRDFRFVRVNEAYAKAAGESPAYFVGKNHFALYPHEESQAIFEQTVRSRQPYHAYATPFTYPDRPERGVIYRDWRLTPLCEDSGQVQFLVLSLDDVTERQNAVRELEHRARQLQRVTLELSEAEDRERKRLAEILHDDLQQMLAAAKFQLSLLNGRGRTEEESAQIVGQIKQMLQDAIEKSRSLSHELGPAVLSQSSLDDIFEWLAQQMESKHGLVVHVQTRGRIDSPSEPVRMFLYKAAREILFNVVKHAEVSEAKLRLKRMRNQVRLTISDKGRGFDLRLLAQTSGFGLLTVRERAEFLGGRMRIKSARGKGSTFLIAVPDVAAHAD